MKKTSHKEIDEIAALFENELTADYKDDIFKPNRKDSLLSHPIFYSINSETEMLRYINKLEKETCRLIIA